MVVCEIGRARVHPLAVGEAARLGAIEPEGIVLITLWKPRDEAALFRHVAKGDRPKKAVTVLSDLAIRCAGNAQRQREREQDAGHLEERYRSGNTVGLRVHAEGQTQVTH